MSKSFFQADVAESSSGSIWTGPVIYAESYGEAEFETLLVLQQDWGDQYMTDDFLEAFGRTKDEDDNPIESEEDPVYPGDDAWAAGDYWTDGCGGDVVMSMLTLPPLEALAQLGKIDGDTLTDGDIEAIMEGKATAEVRAFAVAA